MCDRHQPLLSVVESDYANPAETRMADPRRASRLRGAESWSDLPLHHDLDREINDEEGVQTVAWCTVQGCGVQLSPLLLLLLFIYVNLLNYIDRGLVNGVLPKYCINCPDRADQLACELQPSCAWDPTARGVINFSNASSAGACTFNSSVRPQLGIGGSFGINETEQVDVQ